MRTQPNICTIPAGCDFLATLASALVGGELIAGFKPADNPILLQSATIYVPTRRAARTLSAEILSAMGQDATILPSIRTLGDPGEEEEFFTPASEWFEAPEKIGELERKLQLYSLVQRWTDAMTAETRALFGDEEIIIPASPSDAMWLAQDLADLMDQMATEEIDWKQVAALTPDEQPQWWQLTVAFLKIAIDMWPTHLEEIDKVEPGVHRRLLLDRRARSYTRNGAAGPVVAAGSTGTIPATARLLKSIAQLPDGCVVLPGLDQHLEARDWDCMLGREALASTPNLPQQGLAKFLADCDITRTQVGRLGRVPDPLAAREKIVSLALSPGENSDQWAHSVARLEPDLMQQAFQDIVLIEATGVRQEAMAIALSMREVLETDDKTVALVTPYRKIDKRVAAELRRYALRVDDSGGDQLQTTQSGQFLRLLLRMLDPDHTAVDLVALLKHPCCRVGLPKPQANELAIRFEQLLVRGQVQRPLPGGFAEYYEALINTPEPHTLRRRAPELKVYSERFASYCAALDTAFARFAELSRSRMPIDPGNAMESLHQTAIALSADDQGQPTVFEGLGGTDYLSIFRDHALASRTASKIQLSQFPGYFEAVVGDRVIRNPAANTHPRLHILGPLEARLHRFDRVILAGLNEGTWPPKIRSDPFLNRIMRAELGLSPPERRIGLSAHDFQQLAGNREFFITRSTQVDDAPTVASRWIQRLCAIGGESLTQAIRARGTDYTRWADRLDRPNRPPNRIERPNPKPPIAARPAKLSVSDVETWIRDPYAIYAKHVLQLRPLEPLEQEIGPALRGSLFHEILHLFVNRRQDDSNLAQFETLMEIARHQFHRQRIPEDVAAVWLPRFQAVAEAFLAWDTPRLSDIAASKTEVSGTLTVHDGAFAVTARADRLDFNRDGTITILDYKTGVKPSTAEARTLSPQLPLEGAIALAGEFGTPPGVDIRSLAYVRLRPGAQFKVDKIETGTQPANQISQKMRTDLEAHVIAYQDPGQGFLSRYAPADPKNLEGDYDHLARTLEWYSGGPEDEE